MAVKKRFWYSGEKIGLDGSFGDGNSESAGGSSEPLQLKTVGGISLIGSGDIPLPVVPDVSGFEKSSNKVTAINAQSTDSQYPSAKAVYDFVSDFVGDIEAALDEILEGGE